MTRTGERDWIAITKDPLDAAAALDWAVTPMCGAVVSFCGTVRDHSEGRPRVTGLEYEAYEKYAAARMQLVADKARAAFSGLGRLVLHHRIGALEVGEISVIVVASSAHRAAAFEAGRFLIDEIKSSVPIWKREIWDGGSGWASYPHRPGQPTISPTS